MHELHIMVLLCYFPACTGSQHCCLWQHVILKFMPNPPCHIIRDVVLQLWPLVSLINYKYVPLKLRVLVMQAIAFFW